MWHVSWMGSWGGAGGGVHIPRTVYLFAVRIIGIRRQSINTIAVLLPPIWIRCDAAIARRSTQFFCSLSYLFLSKINTFQRFLFDSYNKYILFALLLHFMIMYYDYCVFARVRHCLRQCIVPYTQSQENHNDPIFFSTWRVENIRLVKRVGIVLKVNKRRLTTYTRMPFKFMCRY